MTAPDFREALEATLLWHGHVEWDGLDAKVVADAVLALLAEQLGGDEVRGVVTQAIFAEHEPGFANIKGSRLADTLRSQFREAADAALAALRDHLGVTR